MVQWLSIYLPMQGTGVRTLVREDPTCGGATKPVHHHYWAWALEPVSHNYWARVPQLLKPAHLEPVLHNKRSHRYEKPAHRNKEQPLLAATRERPHAATKTQRSQKINKFILKKETPPWKNIHKIMHQNIKINSKANQTLTERTNIT